MPSTSVKPTNKKPVNGKRRRPQFRPASQRKSAATNKDAASLSPATPTAADVPARLPQDEEEENVQEENSVTEESTTLTTRRSTNKKRKSTTGVAIGSSRPETRAELDGGETTITTPSDEAVVLAEPHVPDAEPGKDALKSFCSRFRTKEKQTKKAQKANPAQQAAAQHAPTETSAASANSTGPVVQVVNGEIVLQESSVVVPGARRSVQEVEAEFGQEVVEEEAQHSAVIGASYNSFVTRRAPQHWTVVETKKFYKCLRMVGTDFATMAAFFDDRTRKQLKRKYQVENTKNAHLIELALSPQARIPLDMSVFDVTVDASNTGTTGTATQQETENTTPAAASQSETQGGGNETLATGGPTEAQDDEEATNGPSLVAQLEEQVQMEQESAATANSEENEFEPQSALPTKPRARPKAKAARRAPKFRASRRTKAKS